MYSAPGILRGQEGMNTRFAEKKGVISWINRGGNMFGYIEIDSDREIYFDASSLAFYDCSEISVGAEVRFTIEENELGEIACNIQQADKHNTQKTKSDRSKQKGGS